MEISLPDDLIIEQILSRLPVKCLLRLSCVCKEWRDLISNPFFISLHLKRSGVISSNKLIGYCSHSYQIYTLDVEKPDEVVDLDYLPIKSISENVRTCLGWCDGLMCLLHNDGTTVSLLNPTTRKHMTTQTTRRFRPHGQRAATGFFHDPISFDYKLIRMYLGRVEDSSEVMVYSFGDHSWNTLGVIPYKYFYPNVGTLFGGALHWVTSRERSYSDDFRYFLDRRSRIERIILAFNPVEKEFEKMFVEIPQPEIDQELRGHRLMALVAELGGCLALVRNYKRQSTAQVHVWIMKQYGVKESWVKSFVVGPFTEPQSSMARIMPLYIMPNGNLLWNSETQWGWQVDQSRRLEDSETLQYCWENKHKDIKFVHHVESLVSFQVGLDGKQHIVGRNPTLS